MERLPKSYRDFALRVSPDSDGRYTAAVAHAWGGGGSCSFELPVDINEVGGFLGRLEGWIRGSGEEGWRGLSPPEESWSPEHLGEDLYRRLVRGRVRDSWVRSRARSESHDGLRFRLVFDLEEGAPAARAAALPWELLFDADRRSFLCRSRWTPVVRCLDVPPGPEPEPMEPPLRILVALAKPEGTPALSLAGELSQLLGALQASPAVEVEVLEHAGPAALRERLISGGFHAVHFVGHGEFDPSTGEGCLLFEGPGGHRVPMSGSQLADHLRDLPSLRLVFLNACDSGRLPRRAGMDPYTGTGAALVVGGLPAVLALQFPVSDRAAMAFSSAFYCALAKLDPLEAAVTEGRLAILADNPRSLEWATPVLFLQVASDRVLAGLEAGLRASQEIRGRILDASPYIEEKTRGFVGRDFVFAAVEEFTSTNPRGYLFLTGDPGIGKTAVIGEMVRRHGHVHHFNRRAEGIVRPEAFLANVSAQLIAHFGLGYTSLPREATRDAGFFTSVLGKASDRLQPGQKCLVLIDALDESTVDGLPRAASPLFLPPLVPRGIYLVVSTRCLKYLPRVDCEHELFPIRFDSPDNLADIQHYVESYLGYAGIEAYIAAQRLRTEDFVEELVGRSEGNFMFLSHVLPAMAKGSYQARPLKELPRGLSSYYEDHWQRLRLADEERWFKVGLPVLAALTVAPEPISLDALVHVSRVGSRSRVRTVLQQWRQFLHVSAVRDDAGHSTKLYSLYHTSFFEFVRAKEEVEDERLDLKEAKAQFLEALLQRRGGETSPL